MTAQLEPSPSTWGAHGYRNWWGGFNATSDREAYGILLRLLVKPGVRRFAWHYLRQRWVHRRCDTTDFHHSIYCLLDPVARKLEDEARWRRVWTGR